MDAPRTTVVTANVAPPIVCKMSIIDLNAPAHKRTLYIAGAPTGSVDPHLSK